MGTSDMIARFILDMMDDAGGITELQRAMLAERFSCAPSQINYVISTRFSPEHGYIVESRRGGGGYIRITRVHPGPRQFIMHMINAVGDSLDLRTASAFVSNATDLGMLDDMTAKLIMVAVGDASLRPVPLERRDEIRASIFKNMLINTITE